MTQMTNIFLNMLIVNFKCLLKVGIETTTIFLSFHY